MTTCELATTKQWLDVATSVALLVMALLAVGMQAWLILRTRRLDRTMAEERRAFEQRLLDLPSRNLPSNRATAPPAASA